MPIDRFVADERAVSSTIAYVLAIGVTVVLIGGLLMSMGGLMDSQRDRAVDSELRIVGEGIAVDIVKVDRVGGDDVSRAMRIDAGTRVAGVPYTIELSDDCPEVDQATCLHIETAHRGHTVGVSLEHDVEPATVHGGTMWIVVDDGRITLEGGLR